MKIVQIDELVDEVEIGAKVGNNIKAATNAVDTTLTASEAVYGFAAWLSSLDTSIICGKHHDSSYLGQLIDLWVKQNGLPDPRVGIFPDNFTCPKVEFIKFGDMTVEQKAKEYGMEFLVLPEGFVQYNSIVQMIPAEVARRYQVFPIRFENGVLTIALSDPAEVDVTEMSLRYILKMELKTVIVEEERLKELIKEAYGESQLSGMFKELEKEYPGVIKSKPIKLYADQPSNSNKGVDLNSAIYLHELMDEKPEDNTVVTPLGAEGWKEGLRAENGGAKGRRYCSDWPANSVTDEMNLAYGSTNMIFPEEKRIKEK